jgi:uncharacterized membrane protein
MARPTTATAEAARFINLLRGGLYAGLLVALLVVEATLRGVGPDIYTSVEQVKHAIWKLLAAATLAPTLASAAPLRILTRERRRWAFALALAGLLCAVGGLAITLLVDVPINAAQVACSPQAPPADWAAIRDRWQLAHYLRPRCGRRGLRLPDPRRAGRDRWLPSPIPDGFPRASGELAGGHAAVPMDRRGAMVSSRGASTLMAAR